MTTLVTRPEPQATGWADALLAEGLMARPLPLLGIGAPPRPQEVASLWHGLGRHRALMFVSPAAAEWFFRLRPEPTGDSATAPRWPPGTLAAAPGPGTATTLLSLGAPTGLTPAALVSPDASGTQFDSEALWPLLAPIGWQGQRVAIVSGGDGNGTRGRTWLTEQWQGAGALVSTLQAYRREHRPWSSAQQALAMQALATPTEHVWLFSSSEAIDHLVDHHLPSLMPLCGPHGVPEWAQMRALCTHPRIAEHAATLGFGEVRQCAPTLAAVVRARRSHL
jgi:uroporphyrinogen-III synthase